VWQEELAEALALAADDQLLMASVMGSYDEPHGEDLADDFVLVAKLAEAAGARVIELNLSCPNVSRTTGRGLLCDQPDDVAAVVSAVREALKPGTSIVAKLTTLRRGTLVRVLQLVGEHVQGISGINTVPVEVLDQDGQPFFPPIQSQGDRQVAGLSGSAVRNVGLRFVRHARAALDDMGLDIPIIGMGGVFDGEDHAAYRRNGADLVHSVTGVFANPKLIDDCA
jgi:dihydroorotate dehydrogenase